MADGEGFEPSYGFTHNTLSKRAPSATRPSIQTKSNSACVEFGFFGIAARQVNCRIRNRFWFLLIEEVDFS